MNKIKILLTAVVMVCICATVAVAGYYKVYVARKDKDMYVDRSLNIMIKTRYCYEYVYGEKAVLDWSGSNYAGCGKLLFNSGSSCQVDGVYDWN